MESKTKTFKEPALSFKCNEMGCLKAYSSKTGLNNHLKKKHSKSSLYICNECSLSFNTQHECTLHKIKEHESKLFQKNSDYNRTGAKIIEFPCPECCKVFYTNEMFVEHRIIHHNDSIPKPKCKECGKEFYSERKLKEHSIVHKERVMYKCNVCSKVFLRSQTLQYHRLICKAAYPCDKCVDSFMTEEALNKHKLLHIKESFTCEKCNKVFPNQENLTRHIKRHSLRMNYTCQICKESISTIAKFQKHIKEHLESNLNCSVCSKQFQNLVKYGLHKAEIHSMTRPYDCILCTDEFCTRNELFIHLQNHIDVNTSSNSYKCETCDLKFSLKDNFETHKATHVLKEVEIGNDLSNEDEPMTRKEPENPYKIKRFPCTIGFCDQIFESNELLNQHQIFHNENSSDYLHKCDLEGCGRTFFYETRLKQHKSTHILEEFSCSKCLSTFFSESIYKNHLNLCKKIIPYIDNQTKDEDDNSLGPIECTKCFQLFENIYVLKNHKKFCWAREVDEDNSTQNTVESISSPLSILSVYVQNDHDSNLIPEL